jgi:HAMP domain-containing protein
MRLSLQLVAGLVLVTLVPLGLAVLSLSLLLALEGRVETLQRDAGGGLAAARDALDAYLSSEIAGRGPVGDDSVANARKTLALAVEGLRARALDPGARELVARAAASLDRYFAGDGSADELEGFLRGAVALETRAWDSLASEVARNSQSGLGLVAILGGVGLLAALLFSYWLTRTIGYPVERMAEGVASINGGDLHRRLEERSHVRVISRLSSEINAMADRLQRGELDRRVDFLLAAAALEKVLDERGFPSGVLTPGKRLLVANEAARRLADEKKSNFARLAEELAARHPADVETIALRGVGNSALGDLVTIRISEETMRKGPAEG